MSYEEPDQAHPTGRLRLEAVGRRQVCIHGVAGVGPREDGAPDENGRRARWFVPGSRQVRCEPPPGRSFPLELQPTDGPLFVEWPAGAMRKETGRAVVEVTYDLGDGALERSYRVQVAFRRHEGPMPPTELEIDLRSEAARVEISGPPRAPAEVPPSPAP